MIVGRLELSDRDKNVTQRRKSFCRICTAQCGIVVHVDGQDVVRVKGDAEHPLSAGYTCVKGRALPAFHDSPDRLNHPELGRRGARRRATWEELLDDLANTLERLIAESGPDSIAIFTGSGASLDSAALVVTKELTKRLGTRSTYSPLTIDGPSKPLVGALVAGHPGIFGADIDQDRASLALLVGSNPVISHGHTSSQTNPRARLGELRRRGEVWVVDPRRTETSAFATRHLRPRPGTDHAWLAAMIREVLMHVDIDELATRAHGIDELSESVAPYTIARANEITGIPQRDLTDLRDSLIRHGRFGGLTGTGVTMARTGTLTQWLLLALLVITDSADQPGGTLFNPGFIRSLDRETWRPGEHRPAPGPASRPELSRQFGEIPAVALLDEIEAGNVRALLVLGGNLATCMPDATRVREALSNVEALVVADVVRNGTTDRATHLLPCAGQLERADISLVMDQYQPAIAAQFTPAMVAPAYQRRELGEVLTQLADRMGLPPGDSRDPRSYQPEAVFARAMSRSRAPFAELAKTHFLQDHEPAIGWVRDAVSARGGWNLAPGAFVRELEQTSHEPAGMVLAPRREMWHLNSQLATQLDPDPGPNAYLNPEDLIALNLTDGALVRVRQGERSLTARAVADDTLPRGVMGLPHGLDKANVNELTDARRGVDPLTGMPTFTGLPVVIEPATNDGIESRMPSR